MGSSTADEFIQQFETLADKSELDEVALIHLFEHGLHRSITEKIYGVEVMPKMLKGWKEYASHFGNQYRRFQALTKDAPNPCYPPQTMSNPTPSPAPMCNNVTTTTPTAPPSRPPVTSGPGPMDIDRACARCHEEFMKKGLCFRCRQSGHIAKDCPRARPTIRAVDMEVNENSATALEEEKTIAVDVKAVVRAVLAEMRKTSAEAEKKDF